MSSNSQLLRLWRSRRDQRKKNLAKLKAAKKPNAKRISRAEYRLLVAQHKVNKYRKLVAGKKLSVHRPSYAVDRSQFGNVHGRQNLVRVILHSTESHDHPGTADVIGILQYLERTPDKLGIHDVVDKEGNVGHGAPYTSLVYHAKGANTGSIGIEQIGIAHSTEWKRVDRQKQLEQVAKLLAWYNKEFNIPLKYSTLSGVARHADFPAGGHSDPGTIGPHGEYPLFYVIRLAKRLRKEGW